MVSRRMATKARGQSLAVWAGVVFVVALVLFFVLSAWKNVDPGNIGVVFDRSARKVQPGHLEPGWTWINPFTQSLTEYPVTVRTYDMVKTDTEGPVQGDDSVLVQSNEGQKLKLDVVIQYQVIREQVGDLYSDWRGAGLEVIEDRVVRQYSRSAVPAVAAKYGWQQVLSSRAQIESELFKTVEARFAERHLKLITFNIREVTLPEALEQQIDAKIAAQQKVEQQKYQLEQAKVQAEQAAVEAEGKARALTEQAKAEADATLVRARAQAEANKLLSESLTPELVQYRQVDKWDGRLPQVQTSGSAIISTDLLTDTAR